MYACRRLPAKRTLDGALATSANDPNRTIVAHGRGVAAGHVDSDGDEWDTR
jgi:hypothetical protein